MKIKKTTGQAMQEYIIVLFLCVLAATGAIKGFQKALAGYYKSLSNARTGTAGTAP